MISIIIGVILIIIFLIINITLFCSIAFLARITLVDSLVIGLAGGIALYLCNRAFDVSFFSTKVHPVICLAVAVVLFTLAFLLQKTTLGFWVFAVIFSVLWSFIAALTVHILITENMIAFWIAFAVSFLMSISSHIRSRDAEFKLA
ncbi:hypothetical protein [Ruminococcus sp.]|uniref:hypothetical protein n=1 Tax=Ruminococcus sp. TaxID=41978 RepID=UPI0025E73C9A|nr:hypothetical protein [Ruminococcus sp.]